MISVIIVEDDPRDSNNLLELLGKTTTEVSVLAVCTTVEAAYASILKLKPDLIFLDIDLGKGETGFDLLHKFDKPDFAVVFTTNHTSTNNTICAIRACALDFRPKPLIQADLDDALKLYHENVVHENGPLRSLHHNLKSANNLVEEIWISGTEGKTRIELKNILYCESDNSYTIFHLATPQTRLKKLTSSVSIKDWENSLESSDICRVHNCYLVNLRHISKYSAKWNGALLTLNNGQEITVSKSRKDNLKKRLKLYTAAH
jgi:two-component system LytT family response regulator